MKKYFFMFLALSSHSLFSAQEEYPVVILGSGVGALTSAIYLGRSNNAPLVISGKVPGGAITQSHNVQNWPGEMEISGLDLTENMERQAAQNGALIRKEVVVSVDFSKRPFIITTQDLFGNPKEVKTIKAQTCIIALGATPNVLNIPGESLYWSRGVYSCAVCDGSLYKDKIVAVVGGGDAAILEAEYLSGIAKKVYVLVRKGQFRSIEQKRIDALIDRANVEILYQTQVREVKGDEEKVTHLTLQQGESNQKLPVDALFLAIGAKPNTALFVNQLDLDKNGYIQLKKTQETSIEGVFAVGDIADPQFRQAITAASDGAKAAIQVQNRLAQQVKSTAKTSSIARVETPIVSVLEIQSQEQLKKALLSSKGIVFIDFYSTHCAPCRQFAPLYESWANRFQERVTFLKVNANQGRALLEAYQIRAVPTLVILDGEGNLIRKVSGNFQGIEEKLHQLSNGESPRF